MDFSISKIISRLQPPAVGPLSAYDLPTNRKFRDNVRQLNEAAADIHLPEHFNIFVAEGNPFPSSALAELDQYEISKAPEPETLPGLRGARFSREATRRLEYFQKLEGLQMAVAIGIAKHNFPGDPHLQELAIGDIMWKYPEFDERKSEILHGLNKEWAQKYDEELREKHRRDLNAPPTEFPGQSLHINNMAEVKAGLADIGAHMTYAPRPELAQIAAYLGSKLSNVHLNPLQFLMWTQMMLGDLRRGIDPNAPAAICNLDKKLYDSVFYLLKRTAPTIFEPEYAGALLKFLTRSPGE